MAKGSKGYIRESSYMKVAEAQAARAQRAMDTGDGDPAAIMSRPLPGAGAWVLPDDVFTEAATHATKTGISMDAALKRLGYEDEGFEL
jgi:4-aminobutyrate aminotransferase-like enzyme